MTTGLVVWHFTEISKSRETKYYEEQSIDKKKINNIAKYVPDVA